MTKKIILLIFSFFLLHCIVFGLSNKEKKITYSSNKIVVKLLPKHRNYFLEIKNIPTGTQLNQPFGSHEKVDPKEKNKIDLSLIYFMELSNSSQLIEVMSFLRGKGVFEYVERKVIHEISVVPNDEFIGVQDYLGQINAYNGWNVTNGNTSVKIGIVDTGTDMDHPDLETEMYENISDPVNGIDDDGDGYVDNYWGWDFYDDDNDPQVGSNDHGIHVAGIASAATNNNEGVASVGYLTKFVPIRAGNGKSISYGYEGIVYAADLGCDIVNCSWGSLGFSQYGQDVINYATFNKNTLVVGASGNNGLEGEFYPSAYENALSVGSVNSSDEVSGFSNYGYYLDILAPGQSIYSTVNDGQYNYNTGTSMAAPIVSGAAALVKSVYPQLTALQIAERLKSKSDDVSGVNPGMNNKMGDGRLNVGAALSGIITDPAITISNTKVTNNIDDVFKAGDRLDISAYFTNYLAPTSGVFVKAISNSAYLTAVTDSFYIGNMSTYSQLDNESSPFEFDIGIQTPINSEVEIIFEIFDGVRISRKFLKLVVNVDYRNITVNDLNVTMGSKGQIGYNSPGNNQGLGIAFMSGSSQLFESGLMIGTDDGSLVRVMDGVRNDTSGYDNDFMVRESLEELSNTPFYYSEVSGVFNDSNAAGPNIGLDIYQKGYATSNLGHSKYVVLEYTIVNTTASLIENVCVGVFADFDIGNYSENQVGTETKRYYTYSRSTDIEEPLFGVQLLTSGKFYSYGLDNVSGGGGGVDISSGFSNEEKFQTLTTNKYGAGYDGVNGNDVAQVTSSGNMNISAGDSITVAFALIAAETKSFLDEVADSAYFSYNNELPNSVKSLQAVTDKFEVFPNPAEAHLTIVNSNYSIGMGWGIRVLDVLGKEMWSNQDITQGFYRMNIESLLKGVYFVEVQSGSDVVTRKFIKK